MFLFNLKKEMFHITSNDTNAAKIYCEKSPFDLKNGLPLNAKKRNKYK
jgi:hypothetical protein